MKLLLLIVFIIIMLPKINKMSANERGQNPGALTIHSTFFINHYDDVIMTMLASQITSLTVVYSIVYSGVNQRKHQSSASLAFVREIHRGPVNFPHKWPVTRKMFPFDDVTQGHKTICDAVVTGNECNVTVKIYLHKTYWSQVTHIVYASVNWLMSGLRNVLLCAPMKLKCCHFDEMKFSPLAALKIVILTTSVAAGGENLGKMTAFSSGYIVTCTCYWQ